MVGDVPGRSALWSAPAVFTFYALSNLPAGTGSPNWSRYVAIVAFSISGVLALVGLLYSLRDDQRSE